MKARHRNYLKYNRTNEQKYVSSVMNIVANLHMFIVVKVREFFRISKMHKLQFLLKTVRTFAITQCRIELLYLGSIEKNTKACLRVNL